jgi:predicted DNA binding CopG/RHH family protein
VDQRTDEKIFSRKIISEALMGEHEKQEKRITVILGTEKLDVIRKTLSTYLCPNYQIMS